MYKNEAKRPQKRKDVWTRPRCLWIELLLRLESVEAELCNKQCSILLVLRCGRVGALLDQIFISVRSILRYYRIRRAVENKCGVGSTPAGRISQNVWNVCTYSPFLPSKLVQKNEEFDRKRAMVCKCSSGMTRTSGHAKCVTRCVIMWDNYKLFDGEGYGGGKICAFSN